VGELVEPGFRIVLEHELGRLQTRSNLVGVAGLDDGRGDRLIRQYPGDGQSHEAHADLLGNAEELIDGVELSVVLIAALIHLTRVAESTATAFGRRITASVPPGQKVTSDGVVRDDPHTLLPAEREHLTLYLAE
jgi:hypothetical protein